MAVDVSLELASFSLSFRIFHVLAGFLDNRESEIQ